MLKQKIAGLERVEAEARKSVLALMATNAFLPPPTLPPLAPPMLPLALQPALASPNVASQAAEESFSFPPMGDRFFDAVASRPTTPPEYLSPSPPMFEDADKMALIGAREMPPTTPGGLLFDEAWCTLPG